MHSARYYDVYEKDDHAGWESIFMIKFRSDVREKDLLSCYYYRKDRKVGKQFAVYSLEHQNYLKEPH